MAIFAMTFSVPTKDRTEFIDITSPVSEAVRASAFTAGIALINTRHTTAVVLVNECDATSIADLAMLADRLVPEDATYRHNDARYSDCERGNGQAHLRATLFGSGIVLNVANHAVVLGRDQSIILAEFDGPRLREVSVQIIDG